MSGHIPESDTVRQDVILHNIFDTMLTLVDNDKLLLILDALIRAVQWKGAKFLETNPDPDPELDAKALHYELAADVLRGARNTIAAQQRTMSGYVVEC